MIHVFIVHQVNNILKEYLYSSRKQRTFEKRKITNGSPTNMQEVYMGRVGRTAEAFNLS